MAKTLIIPGNQDYSCCSHHENLVSGWQFPVYVKLTASPANNQKLNPLGTISVLADYLHFEHVKVKNKGTDELQPLPAEKLFHFLMSTAHMQSQYERAQRLEAFLREEAAKVGQKTD